MGIDRDFPTAFAKSQDAAYGGIPLTGTVFISVADSDKRAVILPAHRLQQLGFQIIATEGTAEILARNGIRVEVVRKYGETQATGESNVVDLINAGRIDNRRQHAERDVGPGGRIRDPRRRGRGRQGALHDDLDPRGRGVGDGCDARGLRGAQPPGVCGGPEGLVSGGFGERLSAARAAFGPLCVGIDPHEHLLDAWGLDVSAEGAREFGLRVVEAAEGSRRIRQAAGGLLRAFRGGGLCGPGGCPGAARASGLVVIADAKRGDIGTTMDAYARAWLTPGAPLEADAVTVSPYLGVGALEDTFALALTHGKGVFVLAATSNAEGAALQQARSAQGTVAAAVLRDVSAWSAAVHEPDAAVTSVGFVIGATVERAIYGLPRRSRRRRPSSLPASGPRGRRRTTSIASSAHPPAPSSRTRAGASWARARTRGGEDRGARRGVRESG